MPSCSICTENYDASQRIPKVVPCGHTFCLQCINRLRRNGVLKCPTDSTNHCNDPTTFSTNFDLLNAGGTDDAPPRANGASNAYGGNAQATPGFSFYSRSMGKVHINPPNGDSFTIEIDLGEKVQALKQKIAQRTGIAAANQNLFFAARILQQDNQTLSSYGLQNNSVVHMTTRSKGGF